MERGRYLKVTGMHDPENSSGLHDIKVPKMKSLKRCILWFIDFFIDTRTGCVISEPPKYFSWHFYLLISVREIIPLTYPSVD